jgi:hypothetical protein
MPRREGDVLRLGTAIDVSNEKRPGTAVSPNREKGDALLSALSPPRQRHLQPL